MTYPIAAARQLLVGRVHRRVEVGLLVFGQQHTVCTPVARSLSGPGDVPNTWVGLRRRCHAMASCAEPRCACSTNVVHLAINRLLAVYSLRASKLVSRGRTRPGAYCRCQHGGNLDRLAFDGADQCVPFRFSNSPGKRR
jgi:hypothetical protein